MKMKLMDLIVKELNKQKVVQESGEKFERLHSQPCQLVQTKHGTFRNPVTEYKLPKSKVQ